MCLMYIACGEQTNAHASTYCLFVCPSQLYNRILLLRLLVQQCRYSCKLSVYMSVYVVHGLSSLAQVLTRIKQTPTLLHIPVAMLSGLEDATLAEVWYFVLTTLISANNGLSKAPVKTIHWQRFSHRLASDLSPPQACIILTCTVSDRK